MALWTPTKNIRGKRYRFDEKFCTGVAYKSPMNFHPVPYCWGCGEDNYPPQWWNAPWLIERAHIVNNPRRKDRRAIVLLCSECHKQSHGNVFPQGQGLSRLTVGNMLWLKRTYDPWFYDREFLGTCCIGLLPKAVPVDGERQELVKRRLGSLLEVTKELREREIIEISEVR